MPHTPSAFKRMRQNAKRRAYNRAYKSALNSVTRRVQAEAKGKDAKKLQEALKQAIRTLDKAAARGILHKNTASRRKSSLMRLAAASTKTA